MLQHSLGFNENFVYLFSFILMGCCRAAQVFLLSPLSVYLWILTDWIMSMGKVFLGCLADVTMPLINTLHSPYVSRMMLRICFQMLRDKVLVCVIEQQ